MHDYAILCDATIYVTDCRDCRYPLAIVVDFIPPPKIVSTLQQGSLTQCGDPSIDASPEVLVAWQPDATDIDALRDVSSSQ